MAAGHSADASQSDPDVQPIFGAIEQQRAHEHVAEQIRRQIGLGIIAPGDALPPERELARLFGVGRVTIQLAIGTLEADQLITTRRGRSGGSFVLAPAEQHGTLDFRVLEVAQSAGRSTSGRSSSRLRPMSRRDRARNGSLPRSVPPRSAWRQRARTRSSCARTPPSTSPSRAQPATGSWLRPSSRPASTSTRCWRCCPTARHGMRCPSASTRPSWMPWPGAIPAQRTT